MVVFPHGSAEVFSMPSSKYPFLLMRYPFEPPELKFGQVNVPELSQRKTEVLFPR